MASSEALLINCVTWNLGHPKEFTVGPILDTLFSKGSDVIAVNFQEIEETSALVDQAAPEKMEQLSTEIRNLTPDSYNLAYSANRGSVALFMFFKKDSTFELQIRDQTFVYHSYGRVTRGKASIAPRFSARRDGKERIITVIGNHLECYDEEYHTRNIEWQRVMEQTQPQFAIMMGDLNYRIELDRAKVLELIEKKEYSTLLKYDQLRRAKREIPEIGGFSEAEINFAPTYKFDENSDVYDTSSKQRIPSYTDRILVSDVAKYGFEITKYETIHSFLSDHRPVTAEITVN